MITGYLKISVSRAFSLVEMLLVISIMGVIFAFAVPSLSLLSSNSLTASGNQFASYLISGRAKAISEGQAIRIVLPKTWVRDANLGYQKAGILSWSDVSLEYFPNESWSILPPGITWEEEIPSYVKNAEYAKSDPDTTLGMTPAQEFSIVNPEKKLLGEGVYFDFLPNGSVRSASPKPILSIVLVEGTRDGGRAEINYEGIRGPDGMPKNWVHINIHCLTGKVELLRP